jgi:pimeloyl-ACP methyl ester carboxylesterase
MVRLLDQWHLFLMEVFVATPFASLFKTKTRTIDGLSIRYAESAPREMSAILSSPWPESLYTFEQMWPRLAEHAHLIAIDLPGFGHSERRDDLLTSSAMGEFVAHN